VPGTARPYPGHRQLHFPLPLARPHRRSGFSRKFIIAVNDTYQGHWVKIMSFAGKHKRSVAGGAPGTAKPYTGLRLNAAVHHRTAVQVWQDVMDPISPESDL